MVGTDAVLIFFRKRSRGMALLLLFIALCVMPTQAEAKSYAELDDGVYTITNVIADKSLDVAGGNCVNGSNVQVYEGNHTYAQAWRISKKGSSYSIENSITGMVLDVAGGSKIAGANAQLYDSNNTLAQRWKFVQNADGSYSIRSDCNGLFLDVAGGSKKNGANVCLYTSNGTKAQKWRVERVTRPVTDGSYRISTALSDKKMIDLCGGSLDNGAAVQIYEDNDSSAQAWNVVFDQNTGYYSIFSALSGRSFDIPGGSKSSGVLIQQYSSNRTPAQQWRLLQTSDGRIEVVSALTGKALDVPGGSLSNGNQLQMYQVNHTDAQKWTFNTSPIDHSGSFQLKTTVDESGVLDVSGGSKDSGAASQLWISNLSLAQKWVLERQDDGSYTFKNANSGLYLTEIAKRGIEYRKEPSGRSYWILDASLNGGYRIKNKQSGRCIDLSGGSSAAGNSVSTYSSNGTKAQSWLLVPCDLIENGDYYLLNQSGTRQVLDVPNASSDGGLALQTYVFNGSAAQQWHLENTGGGFFTIKNINSGLCLDVRSGRAKSGTIVQQYAENDTKAQSWKYVPTFSGGYIQSALGDYVLSTKRGAESGVLTIISIDKTTPQSEWEFRNFNNPGDLVISHSVAASEYNLSLRSGSLEIGMTFDRYGNAHFALPSVFDLNSAQLAYSGGPETSITVGDCSVGLTVGSSVALSDLGLTSSANSGSPIVVRSNLDSADLFVFDIKQTTGVASMFISSDDPVNYGRGYIESSGDHTAVATGSMKLVDASGVSVYDGVLSQIKGRGNSTWMMDKKPYQIKLDKKTDLLETGDKANKNKTWVLLANAYDGTSMRNAAAYSLASALGTHAPIEYRAVDLYYDGQYRGAYMLCEKVQINSGRVDIDNLEDANDAVNSGISYQLVEGVNSRGNRMKYAEGLQNPADITGGYLIEFDQERYVNEDAWFSVDSGNGVLYFVCKSPGVWTKDEAEYLSCRFQEFFDCIRNGGVNPETGKTTADYCDIDSLARLYWLNEITKCVDGFNYSSTYLFKNSDASGDSRFVFGPAWDFDLAMGNALSFQSSDSCLSPQGWLTRNAVLGSRLLQDPTVRAAVDAVKQEVLDEARGCINGQDYLAYESSVATSASMESMLWGVSSESPDAVRAWLNSRLDWLETAQ